MTRHYTYKLDTYKLALLSGCAASLMQIGAVYAQDTQETDDRIVVTGTRVQSGNLASPVPVSSIDAEYIQLSGETILTDLLQENPALIGSLTGNVVGDSGPTADGTAALNLRNLGESRTLVLVNNRRHVASRAGTAVVDVNTIPTALVERVDVLTGGASAIYGADGVSGVVNFVLKDDFEGLALDMQTNLPDEEGGKNYLASATIGSNFAGGRGNVAVNFEYFRQNPLLNTQRGLVPGLPESININPADDNGVDDPGIPDRILVADQRLPLTAQGGVVFTGPFDFSFIPQFTGDGRVFDPGLVTSDGNAIGGDGLADLNPVPGTLIAEEDRFNVNLLSHYDLSDRMTVYGEFKYVNSDIERETGSAKTIDDSLAIAYDNPFIPASITLDPVVIDGVGTPLPVLLMGRDNFAIGDSRFFDSRELFRTVGGVRGAVTDNIDFDVSYVFGRVNTELRDPSTRIEDRFFAAVDAVIDLETGEPTCRSNLDPSRRPTNLHDIDPDSAAELGLFNGNGEPTYSFFSSYNIDTFGDPNASSTTFAPGADSGCVPLNLFGFDQSSAAAEAFVALPTTNRSELTQHVVSAVVSGDTAEFFELPYGPLGFALGGEYRSEKSQFTPDELFQRGAAFDPPLPETEGSFDVWEVFGEVVIPVVSGVAFAEDLSVGGAVRFSDYSTIGSTLTWRANANWAVTPDVALRGSYSRAIRAPNIDELFQPQAAAFFEPGDPCLPVNLGLGSATREANCRADLAAVGIALEDFTMPATGPFLGSSGGNPELFEETSDSFTFGGVLTPGFIPGLSVSLDYWDIEIEDAIVQTSIQDIINSCYDAPSLDNQFCALLSRAPVTGFFNDGQTSTVNIAFFESSGIDLEAIYRFDVAALFGGDADLGDARIRVVGTRLESLSVTPVPGGEPDDELGELTTFLGGSSPRHVLNVDLTWRWKKLSVNYQYRYQSGVLRLEKADLAAEPDTLFPFETRAFHNHDLSFNYMLNENFNLYAGVNNLAKPSREIGFTRRDRVFFLGANFSIGSLKGLANVF